MIKTIHKGFSVIELLVTLFVAVGFLYAGYQLYSLVIQDSNLARSESRASNIANSYLKQYLNSTSFVCTSSNPLTNSALTDTGISSLTVSVAITCPYSASPSISEVTVTVKYNNPQQTLISSSYIDQANNTYKAPISCPSGFIPVPGSATYNTKTFCVMKYEAKCALISNPTVGLTTTTNEYNNTTTACTSVNSCGVVSTSSGWPISTIDQSTSSTYATNTLGCSGCHLITEAEWMTIAQNVLANPSNWSGGSVGSGYIYSGHNDSTPNNSLSASNDSDGYYGTGNTSGNQKRTLTLTNGETIWDMSGNVWEWTSGQQTGSQPAGAGFGWREWTAVSGGTFAVNPYPSGTGISGAGTWNSSNGIGQLYSDSNDNTLRGFVRSGLWAHGTSAGILMIALNNSPTAASNNGGFRVTK